MHDGKTEMRGVKMTNLAGGVLALAAALTFGSSARAAESHPQGSRPGPSEFVEPILTEETLPNEMGEWDLRITSEYHNSDHEGTVLLPRAQVFFGIADRLGGEIGLPLAFKSDQGSRYRATALSASLKWLAAESHETGMAVSLGTEVEVPVGNSAEDDEHAYEITAFIASLRDFGTLSLQGNIGISLAVPTAAGDRERTFVYDLAMAVPAANRKLYFLAEINGSAGLNYTGHPLTLSPGLKSYPTDSVALGLALPVGVSDDAEDWGVVLQLQFGF